MSRIAPKRHTSPSPGEEGPFPALEVHELLRSLIDRVRSCASEGLPSQGDLPDQNVLLDVELDDVRCLLIRIPRPQLGKDPVLLSPREREIARMVAKGYPNKTIAAVLDISSWTVGTYLRRIFAKLGVGTRAAMVAKLQQVGMPTETGPNWEL